MVFLPPAFCGSPQSPSVVFLGVPVQQEKDLWVVMAAGQGKSCSKNGSPCTHGNISLDLTHSAPALLKLMKPQPAKCFD